jgi:hypothetical protein
VSKLRLRIERWPVPCTFCGSRWTWRAEIPGVLNRSLGCVRTKPVAQAIREAWA